MLGIAFHGIAERESSKFSRLIYELEPELNKPTSIRTIRGATCYGSSRRNRRSTVARIGNRRVGRAEVEMVWSIQKFRAELQTQAFPTWDPEVFQHGDIPVVKARAPKCIAL